MIFNATPREVTAEEVIAGSFEPAEKIKDALTQLLTFYTIPSRLELEKRAEMIVNMVVASGCQSALIEGPNFLIPYLHSALVQADVKPLYFFKRQIKNVVCYNKELEFSYKYFVGEE